MYLATTINSIPGSTLKDQVAFAKKFGLEGVRVSNLDLDFLELHNAITTHKLDVTSIDIHKDWRPNNGSWMLEERKRSEDVFLASIKMGDSMGFRSYSTCIETGFFDDNINSQMTGMRISLGNILEHSGEFVVAVRPKQDDLFYNFAESADHATDLMIHYIDGFHSSKVALDFDVGVHSMYGDPVEAIRKLGSRIRTVTVTSFCIATGRLCRLDDCDLDWPGIGDALKSTGFNGAIVLSFRGDSESNFRSQLDYFVSMAYPKLV